MKILIVSQYYPPEAVPIPADLARGLAERGHDVRVLTGYPNYPNGKIFPGYRQKWRGHEQDGKVAISRVPLWADHSLSAVKRMFNYGSFALSAAVALGASRNADVVYVYATQMTASLGPWLWRITGGAPYVLHIQDLWPDSILGSSLSGGTGRRFLIEKILNPWLQQVYKRASGVIGIAPMMVETLIERGVAREKIELIYNWPVDSSHSTETGEVKSVRNETRIVYAGSIGEMQDLETAIRAACNTSDLGVHLQIIGAGSDKSRLVKLVEEVKASNIDFVDQVTLAEMKQYYNEADYALVTLKKLAVFKGTIPSKFQAVLAHGLPVITTVEGDVSTLTEKNRIGFTAKAESVQSLEAAFKRAVQCSELDRIGMSRRARETVKRLFSKESSIANVESLLLSAVEKGNKNND